MPLLQTARNNNLGEKWGKASCIPSSGSSPGSGGGAIRPVNSYWGHSGKVECPHMLMKSGNAQRSEPAPSAGKEEPAELRG
ncbi:MAG TPA: hypothetical protein DD422_02445 [Akkermansia sp.]|nr:hypothetical protein [Akkermansia sp.]